ncbi:uncharacterized protein G2W53_023646 [Senna tora]|uniref:Uncharacterized protein n=1 Tax=Senna tora TaxID=362788 RepID=A0A834TBT7_9FABA|nr:uncharacterized protein G2W53_023646 [Senna tora]
MASVFQSHGKTYLLNDTLANQQMNNHA